MFRVLPDFEDDDLVLEQEALARGDTFWGAEPYTFWMQQYGLIPQQWIDAGLQVTNWDGTTTIGTVANSGVTLIGKLVTVATMWLGARLVISGDLTVGQLIAFNMLAGQVSQPVMRLAQLYGEAASLSLRGREPWGTVARLTLPHRGGAQELDA